MTLSDFVLAIFSFGFACVVYWYSTTFTCVNFGVAFTHIGSDCGLFFLFVCLGLVLVGIYFLAQTYLMDYKRNRHW